jgi:hypothetical protein
MAVVVVVVVKVLSSSCAFGFNLPYMFHHQLYCVGVDWLFIVWHE